MKDLSEMESFLLDVFRQQQSLMMEYKEASPKTVSSERFIYGFGHTHAGFILYSDGMEGGIGIMLENKSGINIPARTIYLYATDYYITPIKKELWCTRVLRFIKSLASKLIKRA